MRKLVLIRHAKSSWKFPELADIDRPLKGRGRRDTKIMADWLQKNKIFPDLILSSPAKRAHSTAILISEEIGFPITNIQIEKSFYFEGIQEVLKVVQAQSAKINTLFIYGHNPDWTSLVNHFTAENLWNLPTCGLCQINRESNSWSSFLKQKNQSFEIAYPSMFKN